MKKDIQEQAFYKKNRSAFLWSWDKEHDQEGRVITLEFKDYYFMPVHTPNSQSELARLSYRMKWKRFSAYLKKLEEKKPVIFVEI